MSTSHPSMTVLGNQGVAGSLNSLRGASDPLTCERGQYVEDRSLVQHNSPDHPITLAEPAAGRAWRAWARCRERRATCARVGLSAARWAYLGLLPFAALWPRVGGPSRRPWAPVDAVRRVPHPPLRCYPGHPAGVFRHYWRQNRLTVRPTSAHMSYRKLARRQQQAARLPSCQVGSPRMCTARS